MCLFQPHEGIQALQILTETQGNEGNQVLIWSFSDVRLNSWEQGRVYITVDSPFKILIKAIRNAVASGYAAVDDFTIEGNVECTIFPEDAKPPPPVTTTPAPLTVCDFQNGLCGWTLRESNFMFDRTTGGQLEDLGIQGPQTDHTHEKDRKTIHSLNHCLSKSKTAF